MLCQKELVLAPAGFAIGTTAPTRGLKDPFSAVPMPKRPRAGGRPPAPALARACAAACAAALLPLGLAAASSRYTPLWNSPWPADCAPAPAVRPDWARWGIVTNANDTMRGERVTTLYAAGNFPSFSGMGPGGACADGDWNCSQASAKFGGLPQLTNLTAHLAQLRLDIERQLPDEDWSGVASIDWEAWKPIFDGNKYNEYWIFVNRSEELVRRQNPGLSPPQVTARAEADFNAAARSFWTQSMRLCRKLRPRGVWGWYNFPVSPSPLVEAATPGLDWLYDEVSGLFPSIYLVYDGNASANAARTDTIMRQTRAVRDSLHARTGRPALPMFTFTWYDYDIGSAPPLVTSAEDLRVEFSRSATRWGAAGAILWGASLDVRNDTRCADGGGAGTLTRYVDSLLGPVLLAASRAADDCARTRCSAHGRCWGADDAPACDCDALWSGARCSQRVQPRRVRLSRQAAPDSGSSSGPVAREKRWVSYWFSPLHTDNATRVLDTLRAAGGASVATSLIVECGDGILADGRFAEGGLSTAAARACEALLPGLRAMGIGAERMVEVRNSNISNMRAMFASPSQPIAALVALSAKHHLVGIHWDVEPLLCPANACEDEADALAYAAFLAKLRAALNARGVRLTTYVNAYNPMLNDVARLQHSVDRLLDGDTYNYEARPSPFFVLGLPHVTLIEPRLALVSYQDYHMFLITLAGRGVRPALLQPHAVRTRRARAVELQQVVQPLPPCGERQRVARKNRRRDAG